ncbi:MAG: hypothetical protein RLZZ535_1012, partial [Cyanobacteriota bacterium]
MNRPSPISDRSQVVSDRSPSFIQGIEE